MTLNVIFSVVIMPGLYTNFLLVKLGRKTKTKKHVGSSLEEVVVLVAHLMTNKLV